MKRILIWVGIILALGAMIWGLALLGSSSGQTDTSGSLNADPVTAADWQRGNLLAQTTLVEYTDFQCPACGAYYPLVKQLEQTYGNQVRFVYRAYPLTELHPFAQIAAQAAEAAGDQGKFWEFHDMLFENQATWVSAPDQKTVFDSYAKTLGLDVTKFNTDLDSADSKKKVADDVASGDRAGVDATPTFYLNGQKLTNLTDYGSLEQDIKDTLNKK